MRVIERHPPPGLTVSIVDGIREARGQYVSWLDADLSHPPELLPRLLALVREHRAEIACASRYVAGGRDARRSIGTRWASLVITTLASPVNTKRSDRPLNTSLCLGNNWRRIRGREFLGADGSPYGGGPRRAASTPGVETRGPISFAGDSLA